MDISTILGGLMLAAAVLIPVVLGIAAFFILGRIFYKVPGPDDALVITGRGAGMTKDVKERLEAERQAAKTSAQDDTTKTTVALSAAEPDPEFKVVVGTGSWLKPGQRLERLSLAAQEADVALDKVPTIQGINLDVSATVIYKVGDSYSAIVRAARRFAGNNDWTKMVQNVLEGHLRAIVGTMTVEDIWQKREVLATKVQEASGEDLSRLGLQIETFSLKPIGDPSGYIENLSAETHAEAKRNAEITRAENEQLAATRVAETATLTEQAKSAAKIAQAQARQEADRIEAEANQAKPLAEAKAQQDVILEKTKNAELEKDLNRQTLEATVYQQAEAQKYAAVVNAQAQAETTTIQAQAQADASKVQAAARAETAASNAEAEAVAVERAATAEAVRVEAAATADANATTSRAKALQAQGEAQAASDEAIGLAAAKITREQGLAKAEALRVEAEAMSANQEVMVALETVKIIPAALAANASAYARVGQITVMGGMEDVQDGINGVLQQGLASLPGILGAIKGSGIQAALGSIPAFPSPTFNVDSLAADSLDADTPEGQAGLAKLADKVGSQLAGSLDKAVKGMTSKRLSTAADAEAARSSAFDTPVVSIDTSLPEAGFSVDGVSGAIGQAGALVDQAEGLVGQAQGFQEEHGEQIKELAAAAGSLRRRTR